MPCRLDAAILLRGMRERFARLGLPIALRTRSAAPPPVGHFHGRLRGCVYCGSRRDRRIGRSCTGAILVDGSLPAASRSGSTVRCHLPRITRQLHKEGRPYSTTFDCRTSNFRRWAIPGRRKAPRGTHLNGYQLAATPARRFNARGG